MQVARFALPLLLLGTVSTNVALLLRSHEPAPSDREVATQVSRAIRDVSEDVTAAVVSVTSRGEGRFGLMRGSGVVLSPDGLIVTNSHVTNGAKRVLVTFRDGRTAEARVIGSDPESDLAVLHVVGENHRYAPLSASPPPDIGTWVIAVGNPMGLDHTVTFGIISARGRDGVGIAFYEDFLQTDAAINAGNSGGPLVDLAGQVVGINTAKEVIRQGNQGLGFAIPAYMVQEVVDEILEKGYVERGWFGIGVRDVVEPPRGLSNGDHVEVDQVVSGSPAEKAGFEVGDIVLAIGKTRIERKRDVLDSIAALDPGTRVAVDVWRKGERDVLLVQVGEREVREPESRR
jgi:S1-C subfamily serine protease